uniref:Uncharacterized protein n=1 Tax=Romanomermis culicivorax TaxID=13658 RepID=A0A915KY26_ROMCU
MSMKPVEEKRACRKNPVPVSDICEEKSDNCVINRNKELSKVISRSVRGCVCRNSARCVASILNQASFLVDMPRSMFLRRSLTRDYEINDGNLEWLKTMIIDKSTS